MYTKNQVDKIRRYKLSFKKLENAQNRRKLATMQRKWVQNSEKIHALNYLYYRYLTNDFERYLINNR